MKMKEKFTNNFWKQVSLRSGLEFEELRIESIAEYSFGRGYTKGYSKGVILGALATLGIGYVAISWYQIGRQQAIEKCQKKLDEAADELNCIVNQHQKTKDEADEKVKEMWKEFNKQRSKSSVSNKKARVIEPEEKQKDDENQQ